MQESTLNPGYPLRDALLLTLIPHPQELAIGREPIQTAKEEAACRLSMAVLSLPPKTGWDLEWYLVEVLDRLLGCLVGRDVDRHLVAIPCAGHVPFQG